MGDILIGGEFYIPSFIDEKANLFGVEAWGHSVGYEPGCDEGSTFGRLQPQSGSAGDTLKSQVFVEPAKAPWLKRQAPRAGELGW